MKRCPCGNLIGSDRRRSYCSETCRRWAAVTRTAAAAEHRGGALAAGANRALQLGEQRGWSTAVQYGVLLALERLLTDRPPDELVSYTEIKQAGTWALSARRVAEILADLDLLIDDRLPVAIAWIERRTPDIPAVFRTDVRAWLLALAEGTPRTRPRSPTSVRVHFGSVLPVLTTWSTIRGHLREVTRADVESALDPLRGHQRYNTLTALRLLFGYCLRQRLIFTNPTARVHGSRSTDLNLLPLTNDEIQSVERAATTSAGRLVVALAAVHGARGRAIRHLLLADLDLANRRIALGGHEQHLGQLTHGALQYWLIERRRRWPDTANHHVLLSNEAANCTGPVGETYVRKVLPGAQVTLDRVRADRILHEALATGADPLHLQLIFDIDATTATRYAATASRLLTGRIEQAEPATITPPEPLSRPGFGPPDLQKF